MASRLVVTGSSKLANAIATGAESFAKKTKPNPKPLTFSEATHTRIRKIGTFSNGAADLSSRTVGQVGKVAQNIGATLGGKQKDTNKKSFDKSNPPPNYKPGVLNKSMIALSLGSANLFPLQDFDSDLSSSSVKTGTTRIPTFGGLSRSIGFGTSSSSEYHRKDCWSARY